VEDFPTLLVKVETGEDSGGKEGRRSKGPEQSTSSMVTQSPTIAMRARVAPEQHTPAPSGSGGGNRKAPEQRTSALFAPAGGQAQVRGKADCVHTEDPAIGMRILGGSAMSGSPGSSARW
jgi:hypothetical protein